MILRFLLIFFFFLSCASNDYQKSDVINIAYKNEIKKIDKFIDNGNFCLERFDYKNSKKFLFRALKLSKKINYYSGIIASYNNIGVLYLDRKNYSSALTNFNNALLYAKKIQAKQDIADCYNNIGYSYLQIGNLKEALKYFKLAQKYNVNKKKKYNIIYNQGLYYLKQKDYSKALKLFKKVEKKSDKQNNYRLLVKTLNSIGDLYFQKKDLSNAKYYYNKSLDVSYFWEYSKGMLDSFKRLIVIAEREKDFNNLYIYYKSIYNIHKDMNLKHLLNKDLKNLRKLKKLIKKE